MTSCPPQPPRPRSERQGQRTEAREWSSLAPTKTRAHSCPCSTDAPAETGGSAAWSHQPESGGWEVQQLSQDHLPLKSHLTVGKLRPRVGGGLVWTQQAAKEPGFEAGLQSRLLGPHPAQRPAQPLPATPPPPPVTPRTSACQCGTWRSGRPPGGSRARRRWG